MAKSKVSVAFYGNSVAGDTIEFTTDAFTATYTMINATPSAAASHFYNWTTAYFLGDYSVRDPTLTSPSNSVDIEADVEGLEWNVDVVVDSSNGSGVGVSNTKYTLTCDIAITGFVNTSATGNLDSGTIVVYATTSHPPLEYSLNYVDWQSSNTFTGKGAGGYTVWARDAGACVTPPTGTTVSQIACSLILGSITVTNETALGVQDGTATASYSGGYGTITYSLNGEDYQASATFTGLAGGTYTMYAKDSADCVSTKLFTILEYTESTSFVPVSDEYLEDQQITLSYQPELKSWTSRHTYIPNHYISRGNKVYMTVNSSDEFWELGNGAKGSYFGETPAKFSIKLVVNPNPKDSKKFDNIIIHSTTRNADDEDVYLDTFNTLSCWTSYQNSGDIELVVGKHPTVAIVDRWTKTKAEHVNNEYRISIPRDQVYTVDESIFDEDNWIRSELFDATPEIRKFRNQMSDKYLVINLEYDNENDYHFELHTLRTIFRTVSR